MKNNILQLKKAMYTGLIILLLGVVGAEKGYAQNCYQAIIGDLEYCLDNNTLQASVESHADFPNPTGNLFIPSSVTYTDDYDVTRTYTVTAIKYSAFYGCSGLTGSLIIPNSITTIGEYAFCGCSGFTGSLIIPNSVTTIGYRAFSGCSGFTGDLTIGDSVTVIDHDVFSGCNGFTGTLTIGNSVTVIDYSAFWGCSGFTGDLTIPNSVTKIGREAFEKCRNFNGNLSIPNSLDTIGHHAFDSCCGFNTVYYNAKNCYVECHGDGGLIRGCRGELVIGNNVEIINERTFSLADFTGNLIIPNSVTKIGDAAFFGCKFTGDLIIPNSVIYLGSSAFNSCNGFTGNLIIGNSVTTIGEVAFSGCGGFTGDLIIPNSVRYLGWSAFKNCSGFSKVYYDIPNCDVYMYEPPFKGCSGTLEIGNHVRILPPYLFKEADFTGNLVIPNNVIEIGASCFEKCKGFNGNITISEGVAIIGKRAFHECSNLKGSLVIPNSMTSIGFSAFSNCQGLSGELTIPNSLNLLSYNAFFNCKGFSKVNFYASNCTYGDNVPWSTASPFTFCSGSLEVGGNIQHIPAYLFQKAAFDEVIMYGSVDTIGNCAFANCDSLQSITCWNENPPVLGDSVFFGVDKDIPVHVPCGKFAAYKHVEGWEEFNNIQMFIVGWMLTVTSNEPEHCKTQVVQWPICESGEAIVRAKPAPGYRFLGWYENDEKVSQDTLYTFFLGTSRELEARVKSITGFEVFVSIEASFYPNPTKGIVHIEAEALKHITISNTIGQIIYNSKVNGNAFEYNFSKHGAGLYLIRIETANGIALKKVSVVR